MKKITLLLSFMLPLATFAQTTCETAVVIAPGTHTVAGIAGPNLPDPDCSEETPSANLAGSEWFSFTPATTGTYVITSFLVGNPPATDTRVHLYTGTCAALVCAGFNDDVNLDAGIYHSTLVFEGTSGTTYYIAWDDNWSPEGFDFVLSELDCDAPLAVPYTQSFDSGVETVCFATEDVDGNDVSWITQFLDLDDDGTQESFATSGSNGPTAKDDWLFSPSVALTGGVTYEISLKYNGANASETALANESLAVVMTNEASSAATFQEEIASYDAIPQEGDFADLELMATEQTATFTPAADGNYNIAFHMTSPPDSGFLLLFDFDIDTVLATPHFQAGKISMYPNPVVNELNVANENVIDSVEVYNLMGQKVLGQTFNTNEVKVNMGQLSSGAYMVKVFSGNASSIMKVIKQ